eukprot:TRINITY_DN804_c1_g3_i1.p1 TRINITY_DN804_c1_g3~~TRINITY_DN804_c1_g3_i1.p1  ORF type:complete len:660 (+),score=202.56 TRINITY_DN804_c1_g3_i1:117-1982(+)
MAGLLSAVFAAVTRSERAPPRQAPAAPAAGGPCSPSGLSSAPTSPGQSARGSDGGAPESLAQAAERLQRAAVPVPARPAGAPREVRCVGVVPALPTEHGPLHVRAYHDTPLGDIFAVVFGDVRGQQEVPLRVHDQCQTSEVFGSRKCDCAQQLRLTIGMMRDAGSGVLLYMPQEGRGIGLANKMAAYELQERFGCDTVDANTLIGLPAESRDYLGVPSVLRHLEVRSVRLVTNNPYKIEELTRLGVNVAGRVAVVPAAPHSEATQYLAVKESRMGHMLSDSAAAPPAGAPGCCGRGEHDAPAGRGPWPVHEAESIHQAVQRIRDGTVPLPAACQPSERDARLVGVVPALPTSHGPLHVRAYHDPKVGDILALVFGDVRGQSAVPLRVHDQCQTSEVFGSRKCDCAQQLNHTIAMLRDGGCGVLLYMPQEGRGIGLANKMAAYELQERFGCDTVEANTLIGLPDDRRDYGGIPSVLRELEVRSVRLVTNNPYKIKELTRLGVAVCGRERAVFEAPHAEAVRYLQTKERRMGHAIKDGAQLCLDAGDEPREAPRVADAVYSPSREAREVAAHSANEQLAQAALRGRRVPFDVPRPVAAGPYVGATCGPWLGSPPSRHPLQPRV